MFTNMAQVKKTNKANGGHFFDPQAMRFFNSKIESPLIGGRYFVTSERYDLDGLKLYTVRQVEANGSIEDASEFQEFETLDEALTFIGNPNYRADKQAEREHISSVLEALRA